MTATVVHRPARSSLALVGVVGLVVPAVTALSSTVGVGLGGLALAVFVGGAATARQRVVDVGLVVAFASVAAAASAGAPATVVLAALVGAVVAWDVAGNAITISDQLGRDAVTFRVEALHALASAVVGAVAASVGLAVFSVGPSGLPTAALFILLAAATLLVVAVNR
jgi:hypothetical protein